MNRLGFVNFWDFRDEEIFFNKGNALIRGENGSGKSIVLQSAIVFLMDGNMRASRLDPSGTTARQMSYYILGNDEKQLENTGYLYLEFYHPDKKSYVTIGIGLRARRNVGVDFWGFGIADKRIGKDIYLYHTTEEGMFLPLGKKECRTLVKSNPNNFFTDKQQEYERSVNHLLFGLSDVKYKELLNFLIEIRKPIAGADSKKGLRFIYEKLNTSLPIMKEDDLSALTISLQSMDELEKYISKLKKEKEAVTRIHNSYEEYSNTYLYEKFKTYQEVCKSIEELEYRIKEESILLEKKYEKREVSEKDILNCEKELESNSALLYKIRHTDHFDEIHRIQNSIHDLKGREEKIKTQIENLKDERNSIQYQSQENENKQYLELKKMKSLWDELDEIAWELDLSFQQPFEEEKIEDNLNSFLLLGTIFKERVEECLSILKQKEEQESLIGKNKNYLIQTRKKIEEYSKQITKQENEYEEKKNSLVKDFRNYTEHCQKLNLRSHMNNLLQAIEKEDWEAYRDFLFQIYLESNNHYIERNGYLKNHPGKEEKKEIEKNLESLQFLKEEFKGIPSFDLLHKIRTRLLLIQNSMEKENEFLGRQEEGQGSLQENYAQLMKSLQEKISHYSFAYPLKYDKYKRILEEITVYLKNVNDIKISYHTYEMISSLENSNQVRLEDIEMQLDDAFVEGKACQAEIERMQSRLASLNIDVDLKEAATITRKIEECRDKIALLKAEIKVIDKDSIPAIKATMESLSNMLSQKMDTKSTFDYYDFEGMKGYESKDSLSVKQEQFINTYRDYEDTIIIYQPSFQRREDKIMISFRHNGMPCSSADLLKHLEEEILYKEDMLSSQENNLYQKVLLDTAAEKMLLKIQQSKLWVEHISERMLNLITTSGMVFNIRWLPKKAEDLQEIGTEKLENILLRKQDGMVSDEDISIIKNHFTSKLKSLKIQTIQNNADIDYEEIIRECFDYRNWYEFKMYITEAGQKEKELTNKRFMSLSGGERATAIYSSLLSALNSLYSECSNPDHPRFMGLDEAFTVCDASNTDAVFEFISQMDLQYLINSQTLWGTYPSVKNIAISHLIHDEKSRSVAITRFRWDGKKRMVQFME